MLATNQLAVMDLLAKTALKHGWLVKVNAYNAPYSRNELWFERIQGLLADTICVDVCDDGSVYASINAQGPMGSRLSGTYNVSRALGWLRSPLQA